MKTNVMLQGEIGTGKTYSLRTLVDTVEPFVISMEPGIEATLGQHLCPTGAIHCHYIAPSNVSWEDIRRYVLNAQQLTWERLITMPDVNRVKYDQMLQLFDTCKSFTCDGCHKDFGNVADWPDTRAIVVDGLTGITRASRQLTIGARPIIAQGEYQRIQGWIEAFLEQFWSNTKCSAILIAHTDRRPDENTGISQITIDTAGPALVRKLVRKPDEIITAERTEKWEYTWNTLYRHNTITKHRRLPESATLHPDFSQLFHPAQQLA